MTTEPINKDDLTWDELMALPDSPAVATLRRYEITMWFMLGKFEQHKAAA